MDDCPEWLNVCMRKATNLCSLCGFITRSTHLCTTVERGVQPWFWSYGCVCVCESGQGA